jgi:hypothetical protein
LREVTPLPLLPVGIDDTKTVCVPVVVVTLDPIGPGVVSPVADTNVTA